MQGARTARPRGGASRAATGGVRNRLSQPGVTGELGDAWINCVGGEICQIQHADPAAAQSHVNRAFRQQELHERLTLGWQPGRGFDHHKLRLTSSNVKLDE